MSTNYDAVYNAVREQFDISWLTARALEIMNAAHYEVERPSVWMRPKLSIDGNQWCALYGDNLQDGVAGFGDSPALAMHAFDKAWWENLPQNKVADTIMNLHDETMKVLCEKGEE